MNLEHVTPIIMSIVVPIFMPVIAIILAINLGFKLLEGIKRLFIPSDEFDDDDMIVVTGYINRDYLGYQAYYSKDDLNEYGVFDADLLPPMRRILESEDWYD